MYMLTQELRHKGQIEGTRRGSEWVFQATSVPISRLEASLPVVAVRQVSELGGVEVTPAAFERLATSVMSRHFGVPLRLGQVGDGAQALRPGLVRRADRR